MIRYFFDIYIQKLYNFRFISIILILNFYFSLFTLNEFNLSPEKWTFIQINDFFFICNLLIPLYFIVIFPIFLSDKEYTLIRTVTKRRYLMAKAINVFIVNSILVFSIYALLYWLSNFNLALSDYDVILPDNLSQSLNNISNSFSSYSTATIVNLGYTFLSITVLTIVLSIFNLKFGKFLTYLLFMLIYILAVLGYRSPQLFSIGEYDLFNIYTYFSTDLLYATTSKVALVEYMFVHIGILFFLLLFFSFYFSRNKIKKKKILRKILISKKIIVGTCFFILCYVTSLFLKSNSDSWIKSFTDLYGYGYFYPPRLIYLLLYFLYVPYVLASRFNSESNRVDSLKIRFHSNKNWNNLLYKTAFNFATIYIGITVITIFILGLITNQVQYISHDIILNISLVFLEIFFVTMTFTSLYINSNSVHISFLFCLLGYCLLTLPLKIMKWSPFGVSSDSRVTQTGYITPIIILIIIMIFEYFYTLLKFRLSKERK